MPGIALAAGARPPTRDRVGGRAAGVASGL